MAFETNTLVNGEWTTRTLDVDTVLRHYNQKDKEATTTFMEVETAPTIGILTQTVIRSPLVHWILPIRLRDLETQHVAFIGVRVFSIPRPFPFRSSSLLSTCMEQIWGSYLAKYSEAKLCDIRGCASKVAHLSWLFFVFFYLGLRC
jgi:hypothetical protein